MEKMELQRIASFYRIDITPLPNPTDEDVALAAGRRETALLDARRRACTGLQLERARRYLPLVKDMARGEDEDQLLLLALLLDADYQRSLGMEQSLPRARAEKDAESPRRRRREKSEGSSEEGGEKSRSRRRSRRKEHDGEGAAEGAEKPEKTEEQGEAPSTEAAPVQEGEGRRRRPRRRSRRRASPEGGSAPQEGTAAPAEGE